MQKTPLILCLPLFILAFAWAIQPAGAAPLLQDNPTAPPPPVGNPTSPPPSSGGGGGGNDDKPQPPRVYLTRTPTSTATLTATMTLTPTATLTPTLTPTPTPTIFLNLHVSVYIDANANHTFDFGEGVDGLRALIETRGDVQERITQAGSLWYALPLDLERGEVIKVQLPYLHHTQEIAFRPGEVLLVEVVLDQPAYPILLP